MTEFQKKRGNEGAKEGTVKKLFTSRPNILNKIFITKKDHIKIIQINKMIKVKRKESYWKREKDMIEEILENNISIKQIRRNVMLGNKWTTYLIGNDKKDFSRKKMNEIATEFYRNVYENPNNKKEISNLIHEITEKSQLF